MISYRHPRRPGRHHVTVGDATPDTYTSAYDWTPARNVWVTVHPGEAPRHAAPVRPVSLVKRYVPIDVKRPAGN